MEVFVVQAPNFGGRQRQGFAKFWRSPAWIKDGASLSSDSSSRVLQLPPCASENGLTFESKVVGPFVGSRQPVYGFNTA